MPAASYLYVPYDGGRETVVSDLSKVNIIDNPEKQTELYDRLGDASNARIWLSDKGVLVHGTRDDAFKISNIVSSFYIGSNNDNAPNCSNAFHKAALNVTSVRPAPSKPSITGGYGSWTPMAA